MQPQLLRAHCGKGRPSVKPRNPPGHHQPRPTRRRLQRRPAASCFPAARAHGAWFCAAAATGDRLAAPSASPTTTGPRRKRACRSCAARRSLPKPGTRRCSRCSDRWRHKCLQGEKLLARRLLLAHACRSCTARTSLPEPRRPRRSTPGHPRRNPPQRPAPGWVQAEAPAAQAAAAAPAAVARWPVQVWQVPALRVWSETPEQRFLNHPNLSCCQCSAACPGRSASNR